MDEFVQRLLQKTLPADAIAVTFDDGYRDNLLSAKPILARYSVPATLFLATGYVDRNCGFWSDDLATMILEAPDPVHARWNIGEDAVVLDWQEPEPGDLEGCWRACDPAVTARQRAYLVAWRTIKRAALDEREKIMRSLRQRFTPSQDALSLPMTSTEVTSILEGDLVTLGAHTVTHPSLPSRSISECRQEITESMERCAAFSDRPITGFAYPYGDVNAAVRNEVEASGALWACSTVHASVDAVALDPFLLPRIAVPNGRLRVFVSLITK